MKRIIGLGLLAVAACLLYGEESEEEEEYVPFTNRVVGSFTFAYKVADGKLTARVSCATTGWVAVGFNPTRKMKDANCIIGYATKKKSVISDEFGTGPNTHAPDTTIGGTNDLEQASCLEIEGITTISFTIPLDSGDEKDRRIVPGEETIVVFAAGKGDDPGTKHSARAGAKIRF